MAAERKGRTGRYERETVISPRLTVRDNPDGRKEAGGTCLRSREGGKRETSGTCLRGREDGRERSHEAAAKYGRRRMGVGMGLRGGAGITRTRIL